MTNTFTLPMTATDAELKVLIAPRLPEILVKDPKRRDEWQKQVARAYGGRKSAFCGSLFGFGRRSL